MDGPGIRPQLFEMGERLASAGYIVLLPDLFYRAGPYAPVNPAEMFADPEKRAAHGKFFTSTSNAKAATDTRAFLDYLDTRSDVAGKRVGVTGYCMGGGMVLTAAATYPDRIAAAASFHGGRLATDSENSPHRLAPTIKARVLVIGADQDGGFPPEQADAVARSAHRRKRESSGRNLAGCRARLDDEGHPDLQRGRGRAALAGTAGAVRGDAALSPDDGGTDVEPLNDISKLCREQAQSAAWSFAESVLSMLRHTLKRALVVVGLGLAAMDALAASGPAKASGWLGPLGDHARRQRTRHGARSRDR